MLYRVEVFDDMGGQRSTLDFTGGEMLQTARRHCEEESQTTMIAIISTKDAILEIYFDGRLITSVIPGWVK